MTTPRTCPDSYADVDEEVLYDMDTGAFHLEKGLAPYTGDVIKKLGGEIASAVSAELEWRIAESVSDERLNILLKSLLETGLRENLIDSVDDNVLNGVLNQDVFGSALENRIAKEIERRFGDGFIEKQLSTAVARRVACVDFDKAQLASRVDEKLSHITKDVVEVRVNNGSLDQLVDRIVEQRLNDEVLKNHIDTVLRRRLDALLGRCLDDSALKQQIESVLKHRFSDSFLEQQVGKALAKWLCGGAFDKHVSVALDRFLRANVTKEWIGSELLRRVGEYPIDKKIHEVIGEHFDTDVNRQINTTIEATMKKHVSTRVAQRVTDSALQKYLESTVKKRVEGEGCLDKRIDELVGKYFLPLAGKAGEILVEKSGAAKSESQSDKVAAQKNVKAEGALPQTLVTNFRFPSFDPETSSWENYEECLNRNLSEAGITSDRDKKWAFILNMSKQLKSAVVAEMFPRDLVLPEVTYNDLIMYFRRKYDSALVLYGALFRFRQCEQDTVPVELWVNNLFRLAMQCRFGEGIERRVKEQVIRCAKFKDKLQESDYSKSLGEIVQVLKSHETLQVHGRGSSERGSSRSPSEVDRGRCMRSQRSRW